MPPAVTPAEHVEPRGRGERQRLVVVANAGDARRGRRRTLFSIPFKSSMSDADLAHLHRELDLVTYLSPKPGVSGASPGVARLDTWSGLFLERGEGSDEWFLEGRTWDSPPKTTVHQWHIRAALAARELDPAVQIPRSESSQAPPLALRPVGRAANKRLAHLGRRLLRR